MRLIVAPGLAAVLAACAAPAPPAPKPADEDARQACAARMYAARMRGAVHWHIYENCLRERHGS